MYTIEEVEKKGTVKQYLLRVNGGSFYVGEPIFIILEGLSKKSPIQDIVVALNSWAGGEYEFTEDEVQGLIDEKVKPLKIFDENGDLIPPTGEKHTTIPTSGIYLQKTILTFKQMKGVLEVLKYLFHPVVFVILFFASIVLNYYYMSSLMEQQGVLDMVAAQAAASGQCAKNMSYLALFYPVMIGILLIHELGHAASSYYFKAPPKDIGFGFYLIFPVLYTDVSELWKTSKYKRIIVNLGGIYFQLLMNLGLIYWIYHTSSLDTIFIVKSLITLNLVTIFINFNPFFKFDGYWLYSDLFSLPNLSKLSNGYWSLMIEKFFPKIPIRMNQNIKQIFKPKNPALLFYSILKIVFWCLIIQLVVQVLFKTMIDLQKVAVGMFYLDFSICSIEFYLKTAFVAGMFGYLTYRNQKVYAPYVKGAIIMSRNKKKKNR